MVGRIEILKRSAYLAGEVVRSTLRTSGIVEKEGRANIVTAADLASEKKIIETIEASYRGDTILSEETEANLDDILSIDRLWVVDPIDGTNNFRFHRNYSGISIGYIEKGIIKAGVVYDPFRDELFFAERNQGAYLNNESIKVGSQTELGKATIATDNSYNPAGTRYNLELVLKLDPIPWVLMEGSAVLAMCEVASGRLDLYFHTALKPWDNAAAFLLLKEAGGQVKGFNGADITFLSQSVVTGNPNLVQQFINTLRK